MDIQLVVFNWSGTVIDDRKLVYETIAKELKACHKEIEPFDKWLSLLATNTSSLTVSEFCLKKHGVNYDDKKIYKECLQEVVKSGTKSVIYPDTMEVFEYLIKRGKKIAILSYQPESHIRKEAIEKGLLMFITKIVGSAFDKSVRLIDLCEELGVKPKNSIFVGDMVPDIKAAKEAGVFSATVTIGYHPKSLLLSAKPDYLLPNLSALKAII